MGVILFYFIGKLIKYLSIVFLLERILFSEAKNPLVQ